MRIRKLGHACVLVETGDARLLVDPGTLTPGLDEVDGLTAVLVTHAHPDHLDLERLPGLLRRSPGAVVVADPGSAATLAEHGVEARPLADGETVDLGVEVRGVGTDHAVIHPDLPVIPNTGYLLDGRLLHPGDALTVPVGTDVELLCLPLAAPWSKAAEVVDYLRAVRPTVAVPVHDAVLATPGVWHGLLDRLGPAGTGLEHLDDGRVLTVPGD